MPKSLHSLLSIAVLLGMKMHLEAATIQSPVPFNAGNGEGWTGGDTLAWQSTGGPLGAGDSFLLWSAKGGNGPGSVPATYAVSSDWTGDYQSAGVSHVTVDLMSPVDSQPLEMRLVLYGPDGTNQRWTSAQAMQVPNDGQWQTYQFPLDEESLVRVQGNASYDDTLQGVVRLLLRHDTGTPSPGGSALNAQFGMDNIALVGRNLLDCNEDGSVNLADLDCANAAGTTALLLSELMLLPGDLDGDGSVAFADFLILSANFGTASTEYTSGDLDADGQVAFSDFLILSANFGQSFSMVATVPEPDGWCFGVFAIAALFTPCSRGRRERLGRPPF